MAKHRTPKHNRESSGLQGVVADRQSGLPRGNVTRRAGITDPGYNGLSQAWFPSLIP
jgi:hypothetical protein